MLRSTAECKGYQEKCREAQVREEFDVGNSLSHLSHFLLVKVKLILFALTSYLDLLVRAKQRKQFQILKKNLLKCRYY